jgi:hypothetical protein
MRKSTLLLVSLLWVLATGCLNAGRSGGRASVYDSDRPGQEQLNMAVAYEFCDAVAERLGRDLANLPVVRAAETRLVLELGGIENHTATPDTDFELIQKRVQGQLTRSSLVQAHFMIVSKPRRMDAEHRRIMGSTPFRSQADRYDPRITYVLLGDFYESSRADRKRFLLQFTLSNLATREVTLQETYDHAQLRLEGIDVR